ncbi:MAG: DUF3780 domain-containing protein [Saprospiraceae bacterium]|nr:MAG: DUF3780 domain-containing protein [Saprospiraceae bacterium]
MLETLEKTSKSKTLSNSKNILDFGFNPQDTEHHFLVFVKPGKKEVVIFEQFQYDRALSWNKLAYEITGANSSAKVILPYLKWELIKEEVRVEFNRRLKSNNQKPANWSAESNYLHRLFGKELLVLAWAIEDADPGAVQLAIQNWLGLKPEERWWLFTITNAATGHALNGKGKGWRKALRYALTENPVTANRIDMNIYHERATTAPTLFMEPDPEADLYK